jgi:type I restriction enzyme S subunit
MNPTLRFVTSDPIDWYQVSIKDLVYTIKSGKSKKNDNGDYVLYGATGIIGLTNDVYNDDSLILAARVGSVGNVSLRHGKFGVSDNVLVIKPRENSNISFIYHLLVTKVNWKSLSNGTSQSVVSAKKVEAYKVYVSSLKEQQKIAAFFTALDEKISLTMEKISSIRKINNKLVSDILDGGIRFSSAKGQPFPNWKREKFCKSFSVKMCKRIFKEETLDKGDVPFYKIGTFGGKADSYITNELFESYKKKYSYPSKGDTLISCSGTVGRCVIFDGSPSYFQDSNIVWLEPNDKNLDYDKFYLTSVLENLRWDSLSSSTIKRIYSKDLLEKEWFIPCLDEQQIIAEFISMLNNKLAIENEKLSSLMKLKMAFMQQMFV